MTVANGDHCTKCHCPWCQDSREHKGADKTSTDRDWHADRSVQRGTHERFYAVAESGETPATDEQKALLLANCRHYGLPEKLKDGLTKSEAADAINAFYQRGKKRRTA